MCRYQHKVTRNTEKQGKIAQPKKQSKSPETSTKETEVYELPGTEFKITLIKILKDLR